MSVQGCTFVQEGVRCTLSGLSKQSRPKHLKPALEIAYYPDSRICPVVCLQRYIQVTKQFRVQTSTGVQPDQLLIGITKPQACTIARWVKLCLIKDAGIDTSVFTAHSTRGSSSSAAMSGGASLQEVLAQADWSLSCTFHKHYFRPQPFSAYPSAVLNTASNLHVDRN